MLQFDNVSVVKKSNVFFGGLCVSHTLLFPDGVRKTVGVIFVSQLTFNTSGAERMEITSGVGRVRLKGEKEWRALKAGDQFEVAANSSFEIEALEPLDYVCHFV